MIQSIMQSTFECLFNQIWLDIIQNEIKSELSINVPILAENSTRFSPEARIGSIIDELMLATWGENINYEKYYEKGVHQYTVLIYFN